jgi:hypothetical protein
MLLFAGAPDRKVQKHSFYSISVAKIQEINEYWNMRVRKGFRSKKSFL